MQKLKMFAWGFLGAVVAALVLWLVTTLYTDHQRVNALWGLVQQANRQQQAQGAK